MASLAADIEVPEEVELKDIKDFTSKGLKLWITTIDEKFSCFLQKCSLYLLQVIFWCVLCNTCNHDQNLFWILNKKCNITLLKTSQWKQWQHLHFYKSSYLKLDILYYRKWEDRSVTHTGHKKLDLNIKSHLDK